MQGRLRKRATVLGWGPGRYECIHVRGQERSLCEENEKQKRNKKVILSPLVPYRKDVRYILLFCFSLQLLCPNFFPSLFKGMFTRSSGVNTSFSLCDQEKKKIRETLPFLKGKQKENTLLLTTGSWRKFSNYCFEANTRNISKLFFIRKHVSAEGIYNCLYLVFLHFTH